MLGDFIAAIFLICIPLFVRFVDGQLAARNIQKGHKEINYKNF